MLCTRCNERESTGIFINLCDPCFDVYELEVQNGGKDVGPVDMSMKYQKDGGLVPDNVESVRLRIPNGNPNYVKVDFVR